MPEIIDPLSGGRLVTSTSPDELAALIHDALEDDVLYAECARAADGRRDHYTWRRAGREVVLPYVLSWRLLHDRNRYGFCEGCGSQRRDRACTDKYHRETHLRAWICTTAGRG